MNNNKFAIELLALYDSNLVNSFSINEIARQLSKPYPYVNSNVRKLVEQNILRKIVIGRSHLCAINFDNQETILLLCLMQLEKRRQHENQEVDLMLRQAEFTIHFAISSGGRLIFVVEDLKHRLDIQKRFQESLVLNPEEFRNYLVETETIFKSHIVLYGFERFFETIKRALKALQERHSPLRL